MELITKIIWGVALVLFVFILISTKVDGSVLPLTLMSIAATIAAAFVGAWTAYQLQWRRLDSENVKEKIRALNDLQVRIIRQVRLLELIKRDYLDSHRGSNQRALMMRSSIDFEYERTELPIGEIAFILDTEHRNLMLRIALTEDNYRTAVEIFNSRSRLMFENVYPKLESSDFQNFDSYTHAELSRVLGPSLFGRLQSYTDHAYAHVDDSLSEMIILSKDIRAACASLYPGKEFVGYKEA